MTSSEDFESSQPARRRGLRLMSLDWRVLTIELMVVFIGLFAALQLDNYRDQQRFEQAQQRYLMRMHEDLVDYLQWTEGMMSFLEWNKTAVDHVFASLEAGHIIDNDTESFEYGLIYFAHLPSLPLPRSTYDEMVASGMFTALDSQNLQQAISQLFSKEDMVKSNFEWWRVEPVGFGRRLHELVTFYDDPGELPAMGAIRP
ncbi:MAG: hypothetical protein R3212_12320, partial [Xanthomonadales bacterium]|nr:hypothetical protein [Xanthomonadales bacterium]